MSAGSDFGFELLNRLHGEQVNKKDDVLILLLHWYLIKNGFKCIGLGDSKTFNENENGSELLPEKWNQESVYKLRYLKEKKLFIAIGTKSDSDLLINFLKVDDTAASNLVLPTETIVKDLHGPLEQLIPNYPETLDKFKNDLLDPVYKGALVAAATQTTSGPRNRPEGEDDPLRVPSRRPIPQIPLLPRAPPMIPQVGRGDLDPLGGFGGLGGIPGGGGMLFDPFGGRNFNPPDGQAFAGVPGRLPPGAVPPGARFDPFGVPRNDDPSRRMNPDNDHFPPPGYDDMFM